jgi:hypothetical protein
MSGSDHFSNDERRSEYDFSDGVRGKHHQQYQAGTNVVFLDADVAKAFKDSESVNQALRLLLELAKRQLPPDRAAKGSPGGLLEMCFANTGMRAVPDPG